MTEAEQRSSGSPLQSDRGSTNISDTVVSTIVGKAARGVEGVHMGGGASRSAGGILQNITGSDSQTRGVSVEVGSTETAIDLTLGLEYGKSFLSTIGEVRQKITERVQNMTGLKVTELNVTVSDVVFPENGDETPARTRSASGPDFDTRTSASREVPPGDDETRQPERPSQIREREATPVEPRSRTHTEGESGPVPEEEVRAEGSPVDEDETRRLRFEDDRVEETGSTTTGDETAEAEAEGPATGDESAAAETEGTATGGESAEDDRTQEIDRERVSEAEERRSRRSRRQRREDG